MWAQSQGALFTPVIAARVNFCVNELRFSDAYRPNYASQMSIIQWHIYQKSKWIEVLQTKPPPLGSILFECSLTNALMTARLHSHLLVTVSFRGRCLCRKARPCASQTVRTTTEIFTRERSCGKNRRGIDSLNKRQLDHSDHMRNQ